MVFQVGFQVILKKKLYPAFLALESLSVRADNFVISVLLFIDILVAEFALYKVDVLPIFRLSALSLQGQLITILAISLEITFHFILTRLFPDQLAQVCLCKLSYYHLN